MDRSLLIYGWDEAEYGWAEQHTHVQPARVASENRGWCTLWTAMGTAMARAPLDGLMPVTGDWVAFDSQAGVIRDVLPRRTAVSRKKAGREFKEQVLAANVDVLFLVTALDHDFNLRRLERYLLLGRESGAAPVIVLNKADLHADPTAAVQQVDRIAPEAAVILMSALTAEGVAQLHRYVMPRQTAVLLGSSGVGKSTIVNHLLQRAEQATAEVREHDSRGRHTTSSRQMFLLEQGWLLIDSPGLRELEPWSSPEAVSAVFSDIEELASECRFRDCRHQHEPGCAVRAAVESGSLEQGRLESLHKLSAEMNHLRRMEDVQAAQEYKRKNKTIHKAMRNFTKR